MEKKLAAQEEEERRKQEANNQSSLGGNVVGTGAWFLNCQALHNCPLILVLQL